MPVEIGQKKDHDFTQPVGLLGDCHRRIEMFLRVLVRLAREGGRLEPDKRQALEGALKYFREAAPKHTEDEERSLFPRLRGIGDARVAAVLGDMERLEAEHRTVEPWHAEVDVLGRRWLAEGTLVGADAVRLQELTARLSAAYAEHIRFEDERLFPLADEVLPAEALQSIGREMAGRRVI